MLTGPSLLVVDDEPDMGLIVKALGKGCGWTVNHQLDARSAGEFLERNEPDLVLVDVRLPGTSGPEFCRRLRADARYAELRLALFTHLGMPEDVADGLEAGAPYLVSKELICRVDDWRQRVAEILTAPRGLALVRPLAWDGDAPADAPSGRSLATVSDVFRHPNVRGLGFPIHQALARRTLRQATGPAARDNRALERWLLDERAPGRPLRPPPEMEPASLALLIACLSEQLWCLLGELASASVRADLARLSFDLSRGSNGR